MTAQERENVENAIKALRISNERLRAVIERNQSIANALEASLVQTTN